jgi:hypothetical protein
VLDEFGRVFEIQLGLDVFAIRLDGADAQVELRGNLAGAVPLAYQRKTCSSRSVSCSRGEMTALARWPIDEASWTSSFR